MTAQVTRFLTAWRSKRPLEASSLRVQPHPPPRPRACLRPRQWGVPRRCCPERLLGPPSS
eukprot:10915646-Alexandrium_andersonii.AAC.1